MAKRKKKGKWIAITVILIAAVVSVAVLKSKSKSKGTEVTMGSSTRGDITSVVTATGKIFPEIEVKISSEVSGEIVELPVRDGMQVQRGDLLMRVNPDTLEAQVKQQEAALSASKANAAQALAQLLKSQLDLERSQTLFDQGFATQQELDQSKTLVEVDRASHEASLFRIEQQDMQLKEARDMLAKATTYAPIAGTVTVLNAEIGDRVVGTGQFAGTEILRVANLSNMEVRVDVSEAEIVDVKIGDLAEIEIDAIPNTKFEGVVTQIANSAKTTGTGSQEQLTTFEVRVKLVQPDVRYRPGMTATADIRTRTVKDTVLVPLQAVTVRQKTDVEKQLNPDKPDAPEENMPSENNGAPGARSGGGRGDRGRESLQRVVFVVKDGKAVITPVETGIADNRNIEITSGLEADEKIVTGNYGVLTRVLKHDMEVFEKAVVPQKAPNPGRK